MAVYLEGVHDLVSKAFQVNAENLKVPSATTHTHTHTRTHIQPQKQHKNHRTALSFTSNQTQKKWTKLCNEDEYQLTSGSLSTLQYLIPFLNLQVWKHIKTLINQAEQMNSHLDSSQTHAYPTLPYPTYTANTV